MKRTNTITIHSHANVMYHQACPAAAPRASKRHAVMALVVLILLVLGGAAHAGGKPNATSGQGLVIDSSTASTARKVKTIEDLATGPGDLLDVCLARAGSWPWADLGRASRAGDGAWTFLGHMFHPSCLRDLVWRGAAR